MENDEKPEYRVKYERASIKIGKLLSKLPLTPNRITVISILIGISSLYFFWKKELLIALAIIVLASVFDIFDGALARATNTATKFGTILDNTSDRLVEMFIILGLSLGNFITGWLGTLTIASMLMPSYVRARGEAEIGIRGLGVGFFERKEKLGVLFSGMIIEYFYHSLIVSLTSMYPLDALNFQYPAIGLACLIVSFFSLITMIQRLIYYKKAEMKVREN